MSNPTYSVLIYPRAENDLLEIKEYFENTLKTSAIPLFEKFYSNIERLEVNPLIHPLVKDVYLHQLGYRMIPIDNFLVFYIVNDKEVQIHRNLYEKRNYLSFL
jgi:addiction module RelE/StbE family toxin